MDSVEDLQGDIDVLRFLIDSLLERTGVSDDDLTLKAATIVLEQRRADLARLIQGG